MKIPNPNRAWRMHQLSLARIVSEDSQPQTIDADTSHKSSKDRLVKIPNNAANCTTLALSLARIVSEDSQHSTRRKHYLCKSSKDS